MPRRRRYTDEQLAAAVNECYSIRKVLQQIGLSPTGANYFGMQARFAELALDTSHFTGKAHLRGKTHNWSPKLPLSEILVRGSTHRNTSALKRRLIKEGLLAPVCAECGSPPSWRGQPLVLVLDHINGDRSDHRIENLRLLCPNCNSQQKTFAGRNRGRYVPGARRGGTAGEVREARARYGAAG